MIGRRTAKKAQLAVSEAELMAMTHELDEAHREAMPLVRAEVARFARNLRDQQAHPGVDRRRFMIGIGALGAGMALAACGDHGTDNQSVPQVSATPSVGYTGDLKTVAFGAALENQLANAYQIALVAVGKGTLGKVPPAVGYFVQTTMFQHSEHAETWNTLLKSSGLSPISGVPLSNDRETTDAFGAAKDSVSVAKLLLALEDRAAATYLFAMGGISDHGGGAIGTAAIVAPVEAMHSAILRFILGEYPVPDAFLTTTAAVSPATFTG
ncbi:MAG TPA: ferritin-like domain-containing protein [Sporichthyaceae bacterium]|nr:ferritin-like domain-containing protein [Sporichthyaceae bacterium]